MRHCSTLFLKHDNLANFPYKFQNVSSRLYPDHELDQTVIEEGNLLINKKSYNLIEGFTMAYKNLLIGITEGNEPMIDNM